MSDWIVLNEYPFQLLPGRASAVEGGALSYYQYLNDRPNETGKNVQCVDWLLREGFDGCSVEEPFGGCGVFAVALQGRLRPREHRVLEIDPDCAEQLRYCLRGTSAAVIEGDAHDLAGTQPADVYVCDFPYFTFTRFQRGEWAEELRRMAAQHPRAIIITDGSACRYHFTVAALQRRGLEVTEDRTSYVRLISQLLFDELGYSVTECAWHGTCFYLKAEPAPPGGPLRMRYFAPGTGPDGLRKVP